MDDISNTKIWKKNFGLLPIHLSLAENDRNNYILLNGGHGDFCFSNNFQDLSAEEYFSKAWSSNTKNFVALKDDKVHLFNWKLNEIDEIDKNLVTSNFDKFYKYLLKNSFSSNSDVVPFLIDIFKQFRHHTGESQNASEALSILFNLLANLEDDVIDTDKWGLNTVHKPINYDMHLDRLKNGIGRSKPILDLILRHSSGILFQEAQKEAIFFKSQLNLFGDFDNDYITKKNLYTSVHYTPPFLSRSIVENVLNKLNLENKTELKIIDPACGSGEFLIEVLKQLKELNYVGKVYITGWDSSESAIYTSNFLLQYEKRTIWNDNLVFTLRHVYDSLLEVWSNDYDLILMNPPFISWEQMNQSAREATNSVFEIADLGKLTRPNLASAFFYKAINSLNPNGVIGCVIPSSLLTLDSYKKLRDVSREIITIDLIGKLGNFIFDDALTDVSIIIGHKPKEDSNPFMLWVKNEKGKVHEALRDLRKMQTEEQQTVDEKYYSIYKPLEFPITKENWKVISINENKMIKSFRALIASEKLVTLSKLFTVKQGIRTGSNNIFKLTDDKFKQLPDTEKNYFRHTIDNSSIEKGIIYDNLYVWYPYDKNGLIILSEEELSKKVPVYYSMLLEEKQKLQSRTSISSEKWWALSRHRAWQIEKTKKIISTEFGSSKSFAVDIEGKYNIERGYAWIPKKSFSNDDYYFYLAVFSSSFFDKLLSIYSKQLAGANNYYDLGNKYTKDIPIPNIFNEKIKSSNAYIRLKDIGHDIANEKPYSTNLLNSTIEEYFYNYD